MRITFLAHSIVFLIFPSIISAAENATSPIHSQATNTIETMTTASKTHVKSTKSMDTLIVTGTRREEDIEKAVIKTELLTRERFSQSGASSIASVLEQVPSLSLYRHGSSEFIRSEGMNNKYVKILIDGVPVTGIVNDGVPLDTLPVSSIQRVEVARGTGSAIHGSDAMGGVIQLFTRREESTPSIGVRLDNRVASRGEYDGRLTLYQNKPLFSWELSGGMKYDNGFYSNMPMAGKNLTFYGLPFQTLYNASGRMRLGLKNGGGFTVHGRFNQDYKYASDESIPVLAGDALTTSIDTGAAFQTTLTPGLQMNLTGQYGSFFRQTTSFDSFFKSTNGSNIQWYQSANSEARLEWDQAWNQILAGLSYTGEWLKHPEVTGTNQSRHAASLFAQDKMTFFGERVNLLPGLRAEVNSLYGLQIAPMAAIRFAPWKPLSLRTSYSYNYRNPGLKDSFYVFVHPAPANFLLIGDPALRPETSHSVQGFVDIKITEWLKLSAGAYHHALQNQISYGAETPGTGIANGKSYNGVLKATNLDRSYKQGLDAGISGKIGSILQYSVGYGFLDGRYLDAASGKWLDTILLEHHSVKARLTFKIPVIKTEITGSTIWKEGMVLESLTGSRAPNYLMVDLSLSQPIYRGLSIYGGVRNLLDNRDPTYELEDGRNFYAGIVLDTPDLFNFFKKPGKTGKP